jgi:hypothetical protein
MSSGRAVVVRRVGLVARAIRPAQPKALIPGLHDCCARWRCAGGTQAHAVPTHRQGGVVTRAASGRRPPSCILHDFLPRRFTLAHVCGLLQACGLAAVLDLTVPSRTGNVVDRDCRGTAPTSIRGERRAFHRHRWRGRRPCNLPADLPGRPAFGGVVVENLGEHGQPQQRTDDGQRPSISAAQRIGTGNAMPPERCSPSRPYGIATVATAAGYVSTIK